MRKRDVVFSLRPLKENIYNFAHRHSILQYS